MRIIVFDYPITATQFPFHVPADFDLLGKEKLTCNL